MSHLVWGALAALTAALACASPTPPEPSAPEPGAPSTEPSASPAVEPPAPEGAPGAAAPVAATLFVREQRVDCQGEEPRRCLQVRESESEPWRNLYAAIAGFDYEESNAYELRVEVVPVPHPPADAASVRYRLLEVVSKRKVPPSAASK
ncbi:MAG: DUF4377 domain-containing protein [Deltaproteobacteria bacterium]